MAWHGEVKKMWSFLSKRTRQESENETFWSLIKQETVSFIYIRTRIWDTGSGAFLTPGSWIGIGKNQDPGLNIPDHIFESLEAIFGLKMLKFFDAEPGSGIFLIRDRKIRIQDTLRHIIFISRWISQYLD